MALLRPLQRMIGFCLTVVLWGYFMFGYLFILLFLFVPYYWVARGGTAAFQKLNHLHLKGFFMLTRRLIPRTTYIIDPKVRELRSSIIICNHISYLDPILLVSLFSQQTTIVKNTFFRVPIFGWFLRRAGYVPSSPAEMLGEAMIKNLENVKAHLAAGGIFFVFPEGTRSRDGSLSTFNRGVFSIARYCGASLDLVFITGTDQLFRPGTFSFNTRKDNVITLELIASIHPDYQARNFSISSVLDQARQVFEQKIADVKGDARSKAEG